MTANFVSNPEIRTTNYIHGTKPEEQKRLSLLNRILNEKSLKEINLQGGEKILDVGSGLGQFSRLMARTVGEKGSVTGIERDAEQLNEARRQASEDGEENLVEFRQGDALRFPLAENEWGTFDVAHTRFVLEHIPNPLAVVKAMVKSVRAGGRVILEDDNHDSMRLYPASKNFDALWRAYYQTYEILGNDPLIGNKLVSLLYEAGAKPVRNTWIFFGSCAGDANFKFYIENLLGVIEGAKELIIGANLLDEKSFDAGINAINDWRKLPDAAIWFSLSYAEGVRSNFGE
jgi:ubiquinone/menaquinone biosynthesis C-methylase UbiE